MKTKNMFRLTPLALAIAAALGSLPAPSLAAGGTGASTELEEIVVTGLKRDQALVEVPVAVSVFTTEEIARANITRPGDYLTQVPNVTFITANHAGEAFVNIRGQTSVRQSESAVAVVIDGVQLATQNEFNGELFDIRQIEVLKGPQGAIYGRNAAAGAIVITTRQPTDEFEGKATLGYGNYKSTRATATFSGPLVEGKLRFRVSGAMRSTDGPFRGVVSGEDVMRSNEDVGRVQLDFQPTDALRFDLRFNTSSLRGGAIAFNAQADIPGFPLCGATGPIDADETSKSYCSNIFGANRQSKNNGSLKITYDTGFGTFASVSAYNKISDKYQADNFPYVSDSGSPGALTQKYRIDNKAFTQELRFNSVASETFNWMAGVYFLDADRRFTQEQGQDRVGAILPTLTPDLPGSANPTTNFFDTKYGTKNTAVFANAQYRPIESFEIGLAGRFDREKRSIHDVGPAGINPVTGLPYTSTPDQRDSRTFKEFTPKITLTYLFKDTASIYASYGKGFKSGGFNPFGTRQALLNAIGDPNLVFIQDSYNKETSDTYEVGFKSSWADGMFDVNGAVFTTKVKGSQQFEFFPSAGLQAISQIDEVKIDGWEIELRARPIDGLTLTAGWGSIDNKIKEFRANPAFVGNRSPYAAKNNGMFAAGYDTALGPDVDLSLRADVTRTGSIGYVVQNYPGSVQSSVTLLNGRVGITRNRVEFAVWARNLTNEKYNADVVPLLPILQAVYRALPRTYGIEANYTF